MKYKKVLGLEIHAQIATKTKLFSRALVDESASPNENVDWVDAGLPGALPVLNEEAVNMALTTSLALDMEINEISIFDRKHYFYQDLPLGYQISQFYHPIGVRGNMECAFGPIRINRLHIETDAGKTINENGEIYVDLNRSGVPLMEIVTEPDFHNEDDVIVFLKELRAILLTLKTCKCDLSMGNFRVDVNLSIHKEGEPLGTRVEIKNLNSFKSILKAIEYEYNVQVKTLESGNRVMQETKLFDSNTFETKSMRLKETSADYRYFKDPDLLPIKLTKEKIADYKANLPTLPSKTRQIYQDYGIAVEQSYTIAEHPIRIKFFNDLVSLIDNKFIVKASNWMCSELVGKLSRIDVDIEDLIVQREDFCKNFAQIIMLCEGGQISRSNAKEILDALIESSIDIDALIKKRGFLDKLDDADLVELIKKIIESSPKEVEKFKKGKVAIVQYFVGMIMKETKGKCDVKFAEEKCIEILKAC